MRRTTKPKSKSKSKSVIKLSSSDWKLIVRLVLLSLILGILAVFVLWITKNMWFLPVITLIVGLVIGRASADKTFRDKLGAKTKAFFRYFLSGAKKKEEEKKEKEEE